VLDIAVASKAKVLFGSSSALYGPRREGQVYATETDPCVLDHLTPFGAYDEGKRFAEAILYTYADVYKLEMKIARLFRTYGPRMKIADGNLIPDMINAALDGKDIELSCREEEKIGLCYVSDIVDGLIKYMQSPTPMGVMNLGSDQEYSVTEIAEKILRSLESTARVHCKTDGGLGKEAPLPNIDRARQTLHWLPLIQLEQGLDFTIQDARSRRTQMHAFG
jgi:nucleoside-diphosphate-sugar epimerase